MKTALCIPALLLVTAVSGCIDQSDYRTTPVEVQTEQGVVVCQLYTKERVLWDEAVSAPPGMSIATADKICMEEGTRRASR